MNWIQGYWYVVEICTLCTLRWKKKCAQDLLQYELSLQLKVSFTVIAIHGVDHCCHPLMYKLRLIFLWGILTVIIFWGSIMCGWMFLLVPVLAQRFSPGYLVFLPLQKSSFQVLNLTQKTSFGYASVKFISFNIYLFYYLKMGTMKNIRQQVSVPQIIIFNHFVFYLRCEDPERN